MEPTEQIAHVVVLGLAFLLIVWGLLKLRGTGLLQRRKTEEYPFISREHNPPEDFTIDVRDVTIDVPTIKQIRDDFQKEDDLE